MLLPFPTNVKKKMKTLHDDKEIIKLDFLFFVFEDETFIRRGHIFVFPPPGFFAENKFLQRADL